MGCNKNAICVRVNSWNINSTWTMYEQYYALCFFFSQQPRLSIFSIWTTMFCFTHWFCLIVMRRKFYNNVQCKDILDPPFHYNNGCTFKWFLEHNNELVCIQTFMPIFPGKIFPKTWYNAKFLACILSIYQLPKGLPFLECLNTVVGHWKPYETL